MTSKHPKTEPKDRPRNDLVGASTFEGDTENETGGEGAIRPEQMPRENR